MAKNNKFDSQFLSDLSEEKKVSLSKDSDFFAKMFSSDENPLLSKIEIISDNKGDFVRYNDGFDKSCLVNINSDRDLYSFFNTVDNYFHNEKLEKIPDFTFSQDGHEINIPSKVLLNKEGDAVIRQENKDSDIKFYINLTEDGRVESIYISDNDTSTKIILPNLESGEIRSPYETLQNIYEDLNSKIAELNDGDSKFAYALENVFVKDDYEKITFKVSENEAGVADSLSTDSKNIDTISFEFKGDTLIKIDKIENNIEYKFSPDALGFKIENLSDFKENRDEIFSNLRERIDSLNDNFVDKDGKIYIQGFFDTELHEIKHIDIYKNNTAVRAEGKLEASFDADGNIFKVKESIEGDKDITMVIKDGAISIDKIEEKIDGVKYSFRADFFSVDAKSIQSFSENKDTIFSEMRTSIDNIKDNFIDGDNKLSIDSYFNKNVVLDITPASVYFDAKGYANITCADHDIHIKCDADGRIERFEEKNGDTKALFTIDASKFNEMADKYEIPITHEAIEQYIENCHISADNFLETNGFDKNDVKDIYMSGAFIKIEVYESRPDTDNDVSGDTLSDSKGDTERTFAFSFNGSDINSIEITDGKFRMGFSAENFGFDSMEYFHENKETLIEHAENIVSSLLGDNFAEIEGTASIKTYGVSYEFKQPIDGSDLKQMNKDFFSEKVDDNDSIKKIDIHSHDSDIRHDTCSITFKEGDGEYTKVYDLETGHLDKEHGDITDKNGRIFKVEILHVDIPNDNADRAYVKILEFNQEEHRYEKSYTGIIDSASRADMRTDSSVTSYIYQQVVSGNVDNIEGLRCKEISHDSEDKLTGFEKLLQGYEDQKGPLEAFADTIRHLDNIDSREYYSNFVLNADGFDRAIAETEQKIAEIKDEICKVFENPDGFDSGKLNELKHELKDEEDKLRTEKGSGDFNSGKSGFKGLDYLNELKENKAEIARLGAELEKEEAKENPDSDKIKELKDRISGIESRTDNSAITFLTKTNNLGNELLCKAILPHIESPLGKEIFKTIALGGNNVQSLAKIIKLIDGYNKYYSPDMQKVEGDKDPIDKAGVPVKPEGTDGNFEFSSLTEKMPSAFGDIFKSLSEFNPFKMLGDLFKAGGVEFGKVDIERNNDKERGQGGVGGTEGVKGTGDGEPVGKAAVTGTQVGELDATTDTEHLDPAGKIEKAPINLDNIDPAQKIENGRPDGLDSKISDFASKVEKIIEGVFDKDKCSAFMDKLEGLLEKFIKPDTELHGDKGQGVENKGVKQDGEIHLDKGQGAEVKVGKQDGEIHLDKGQGVEAQGIKIDGDKNLDGNAKLEVGKLEEASGDKSRLEMFIEKFENLINDALDKDPKGAELKEKLVGLCEKFIETLDKELFGKTEVKEEKGEKGDKVDGAQVEKVEEKDKDKDPQEGLKVEKNGEPGVDGDPNAKIENGNAGVGNGTIDPPPAVGDGDGIQVDGDDDDDGEGKKIDSKLEGGKDGEDIDDKAKKSIDERVKAHKEGEGKEGDDDESANGDDSFGDGNGITNDDDDAPKGIDEKLSDLFDKILDTGNFKELFNALCGAEMKEIMGDIRDVLMEVKSFNFDSILDTISSLFSGGVVDVSTFESGSEYGDVTPEGQDVAVDTTELAGKVTTEGAQLAGDGLDGGKASLENGVKPVDGVKVDGEPKGDVVKVPEEIEGLDSDDLLDGYGTDTDGNGDGNDGADGFDGADGADAPPPGD